MANVHGGQFRKYVTVTSNAKNNPSMRLSLGGTLMPDISAMPQFIRVTGSKKGSTTEVVLSTEKKDFKVTDVTFNPKAESAPSPGWQQSLPVPVTFSMAKKDTVRTDGYIDYKVKLSLTYVEKESKQGDFVFKTNHPKKIELKVPGMIEGAQ